MSKCKTKTKFFFGLLIALPFIFFSIAALHAGYTTVSHENLHYKIFLSDGCTDPIINYDSEPAYTFCSNPKGFNSSEMGNTLHYFNEIVNYNVQDITASIYFTGFIISFLLVLLWGIKE